MSSQYCNKLATTAML